MARKCNFDREEKLHQAMTLFWQKGYANTAISDLVDHLQINRFSLYNAFGDKQKLYYEAWIHILSATLKNKTVSRHNPYFSSRQEVKKNDL